MRQSHQAFPSVQLVERSESVNRRDISSFRAKMKVWIKSRSLGEPTQISLVFQIFCYYHVVYNNASFYLLNAGNRLRYSLSCFHDFVLLTERWEQAKVFFIVFS